MIVFSNTTPIIALSSINRLQLLSRIAELISAVGLENVHEPHIKHIEGQLWEIRLKGKDGIARALYVTARQARVLIVRVFIKKTEKTPRQEIEIALQRAKEIQ